LPIIIPDLPAALPVYKQWPFLLVSALAILLGAGCLFLSLQNAKQLKTQNRLAGNPALQRLWSRTLDSPLQTDIVLPDTSFALLQEISNQPITLSEYLKWGSSLSTVVSICGSSRGQIRSEA
jgi:hypothetical protein